MKQPIFTLVLLAFLSLSNLHAQVGIGTITPDDSSILEVESTTKGFLPPRLTTDQRKAITNPAEGLVIYNTTNTCMEWFTGTGWFNACEGTLTGPPIVGGPCDGEPQFFFFHGLEYRPIEQLLTNACWLDRNLGSTKVAAALNDFEAYGNLYQWGRNADGHEVITWIATNASDGAEQLNESTTQSSSPSPGSSFIIGFSNWYNGTSPAPNDLWKEDGTGINNPCPAGYRVPTNAEWITETDSWDGTLDGSYTGSTPGADAFASLQLPMEGRRANNNGSLGNVGANGNYWSSTSGNRIFFSGSDIQFLSSARALGASVRCIKD